MAVTPRRSLDDYAVDNLACSICGQPSLQVKKVNNLPDFVSCTSCQAAFLVEEGGARVLYGQIPDSYPETKSYALKKWLLREAIDLQALKERPALRSRKDMPAPPTPPSGAPPSRPAKQPPAGQPSPGLPEAKMPAQPQQVPDEAQPVQPSESSEQGPPSFSGVHLGEETPAQGMKPVKPSSPPPQTPSSGPPEAEAPVERQIQVDFPKADQFPSPDPSPPKIEEPDWLKPPQDQPDATAEPAESETVRMPEDPFAERFATPDEIESAQASAQPDTHEVSHGIAWPSTSEEEDDPSSLPDWLRPDQPGTPRDKTPDLSAMPGVPIPTEPMSEPPESGIALESQPRLKPRHYDTLPPQPGTPAAAAGEKKPADPPPVPTPSTKEDISRPMEEAGPGFKLTPNDPVPDERYRVVIKGVKVQLPTDFCAHCGRAPVKGRVVVMGSLPSSKVLGQRQPTQFNIPLCDECHQRSQHPKEDVQSARLQASLVSTLMAVIVLVLGLVFGLVNLQSTSIPNLMILLVLAAIGYAIPAVILFGRIQDMPITPEMHYIQTTLIVPTGAQGLETAFEWRNPLYAQRFAELNQQNVVGAVSQIKQRPMM
jgi:hypothetical protein